MINETVWLLIDRPKNRTTKYSTGGDTNTVFYFTAVQLQICIQNRYKLNKKYRKILPALQDETESLENKTLMEQARVS